MIKDKLTLTDGGIAEFKTRAFASSPSIAPFLNLNIPNDFKHNPKTKLPNLTGSCSVYKNTCSKNLPKPIINGFSAKTPKIIIIILKIGCATRHIKA